jgi:hypothetical protein
MANRVLKTIVSQPTRILVAIAAAIGFAWAAYYGAVQNTSAFQEPYATSGQWSSVYSLSPAGAPQVAAVHMHVLPNGKVLMWDWIDGTSSTDTWLWDPAATLPADHVITNLQRIVNSRTVLFCSGHAFLPDGRLLVAGGGHGSNMMVAQTNIFDYRTNLWSAGPDMPAVPAGPFPYSSSEAGRWYPTVTPLANGEMLIASGESNTSHTNQTPIVYMTNGNWRKLLPGGVPAGAPWETWYPFLFAAPNGNAFRAGGSSIDSLPTGYLDTLSGAWTQFPTTPPAAPAGMIYSSAVMYEPGKMLVMGGGNSTGGCTDPQTTSKAARKIDLNAPSPVWLQVTAMQKEREFHNATLLADGQVLVTGGLSAVAGEDTKVPELWNPTTSSWTSMAPMSITRGYHSTAVLLPDGRVVSAGTRTTGCSQPNLEIYSPPYLFRGPRPVITSAPTEVSAAQSFVVVTPDTNVTQVSWVRLSSVTHSFNENQRFVRSATTPVAGGVSVTAPGANEAPPGHYMLFLLKDGVPSVASIVRIVPAASFNDSHPDLVWRNVSTGQNKFWLMDGLNQIATPSFSPSGADFLSDANWEIRAVGDMNGDGKPDVIWQNAQSGQIAPWLFDGTTRIATPNFSPGYETDLAWKIMGAADMNRDGYTDLVWQHHTSGQIRIWHMNGVTRLNSVTLANGVGNSAWEIAGLADMNGDQWPDLVWRDYAGGSNAVWMMQDSSIQATPYLSPQYVTDTNYRIVGVADIDGNGKPDLVWRHGTNGNLAVWFMDGVTAVSYNYLNPSYETDLNWRIVGMK